MNTTLPAAARERYRIGLDIGGTFTDFVLLDTIENRIRIHKYLTTPADPSVGAMQGLRELVAAAGIQLADVAELVHGTTLVTNALIERRGAALGLLTTQGMRDVIELGTEQRYDIHDLFLKFPPPLVPRFRRLGIPERLSRDGEILLPLDEAAVRRAVNALAADGVEALAICFLHSYRDPRHERRAAAIAREACPQLAISISADVVPELREYPRFITTCANAYVQPLMDRYIQRLEYELRTAGFGGVLRLMHSAGGLVSPDTARKFPIRLLESGPAGGGLATAWFGSIAGKPEIISFDMGGTTAKTCLIEGGRPEIANGMEAAREHRFKRGSGLPIRAPVIEMIEIGAGGGSIAALDEVGLLRVGPRSAGADPGPACYARGGSEPTVTDANLLLGYYDPHYFLGGRMRLDVSAAETAMARVAEPLRLGNTDAAWGVHRLVTESMAAAARLHVVERGRDPRRYAMVAFGGAGPAHAAEVARLLGVTEVLIPPASGAASALGFLAAPLSFEQSLSLPVRLRPGFNAAHVNEALHDLETKARALVGHAGVRVERSAEMRLVGQMHEITVALPAGIIGDDSLSIIREKFASAYKARYTTLYENAEIEVISFRVRCSGPPPQLSLRQTEEASAAPARKGERRARFAMGIVDAAVCDRYALRTGDVISGPAMIEEREATTVVPPGDIATVDVSGMLRISVAAPHQAVVTGATNLDAEIRRIEADPIALEIMWSRLVQVTQEMWGTVVRTAFSLTMCESQDFACDLLGADGEALAHSPQAMPVFNLTLPRVAKALLQVYPAETLQPGDVLITNDPWLCVGHLFDVAVVTPVFRGGKLVALTGTIGHVTDIGGTLDPLQAHDVYEEGLQIPPVKLYRAGEPNHDMLRMIRENVRKADQVLGDLHALIAANARGAERLLAFMDDYGMSDLRAIATVVQGLSERAMRQALAAFPKGSYGGEIYSNPLGTKLRFPLRAKVDAQEIILDFAGAPPQLPQGGINVVWNYSAAYVAFVLKCMLSPSVRGNAGCYRAFDIRFPEGSVLNCRRPASVSIRQRNGWFIPGLVQNTLAPVAPETVRAFSGLPGIVNWYAQDADGTYYSDMMFSGGGEGGSAHADGKSGMIWPTSAANTSVELFELRIPIVVMEKEFIADTAGPGRHRGGLGARVRFRKLHDDKIELQAAVFPEGADVPKDGLFGGGCGVTPRGVVHHGANTVDCGAGRIVRISAVDAVVELQIGGGSGFGDPLHRPAEAVAYDVRCGYVSAEAAAREYGVTIHPDGRASREVRERPSLVPAN